MNPFSHLARLRVLGVLEGTSFLALLLVAMPLKHFAGNPTPVKILGSVHGGLFVLYCLAALMCAFALKWNWKRLAFALAASVVPLGPFIFESHLKKHYGPLRR